MEKARFYGIYRGTVASSKDPLDKRRLKLFVPPVTGPNQTNWAWPLETASVKVASPSVGQGVWVMFEGGDPAYPVWVGTFGKVIDQLQHVLISPQSSNGAYINTSSFSDGRIEVDLVATLITMSEKLEDLETRVSQNETDIAGKADSGHSHPGL